MHKQSLGRILLKGLVPADACRLVAQIVSNLRETSICDLQLVQRKFCKYGLAGC